jgi:hypothetical protein
MTEALPHSEDTPDKQFKHLYETYISESDQAALEIVSTDDNPLSLFDRIYMYIDRDIAERPDADSTALYVMSLGISGKNMFRGPNAEVSTPTIVLSLTEGDDQIRGMFQTGRDDRILSQSFVGELVAYLSQAQISNKIVPLPRATDRS